MTGPESPGWFVRVYGPAGRLLWEQTAPGWRYGQASSGTPRWKQGIRGRYGQTIRSGPPSWVGTAL